MTTFMLLSSLQFLPGLCIIQKFGSLFWPRKTLHLMSTFKNSMKLRISLVWFSSLLCFFGSKGHVALDRNPGPGYDTLLLRMIPGDLLSAFPHRKFHTLPGLLVPCRCYEGFLFRRFIVPKVRWSEGSLIRRFVGPKVR